MDDMRTDGPSAEKRFFSDQLMLELGLELVERSIISREQLDQLSARKALTGETLHTLLLKEDVVPEGQMLGILAELTGLQYCHIGDYKITPEVVEKLQARAALRYHVLPVQLDGGVVTLAVSEVPTQAMADSLRMLLDMAVEWVLCTESDIHNSIKHFYGLGAETIDDLVQTDASPDTAISDMDLDIDESEEGIIKFVNQIIAEAIRMGATDVHIEPYRTSLRLRYRIDGLLQNIPVPPGVAKFRKPIASCVKIMADLNIAEKRLPHDGRIKVQWAGDDFDLRVSILPTAHGETVNMRILNSNSMFIDLEHLGLAPEQQPMMKKLADLPHGVMLLTGPTGSGKTTTLYAILAKISTPEVKVITVEEPIEYQMEGINQIQVHSSIGLTFSSCLRSILRHDPDIVLIGEIRDSETADIAVRASLTGHLVLRTLHTNDAPSAVTRLIDMGVEPYLISSCLEGVIAQRLVRRVCADCRKEMIPDDAILEEIRDLEPELAASATYFEGSGCPACSFSGYRGRIGIFEIMVMDEAIRHMVIQQRPANEIKKVALAAGMTTLRRDGWLRTMDGTTSVNEVIRIARKAEA